MITGAIRIDLSQPVDDQGHLDRRRLCVLDQVPDGGRVIIDIGSRQFVSQDAARWLHEHDARLLIEVCGTDPAAVGRVIRAGRAGEWEVGA